MKWLLGFGVSWTSSFVELRHSIDMGPFSDCHAAGGICDVPGLGKQVRMVEHRHSQLR